MNAGETEISRPSIGAYLMQQVDDINHTAPGSVRSKHRISAPREVMSSTERRFVARQNVEVASGN